MPNQPIQSLTKHSAEHIARLQWLRVLIAREGTQARLGERTGIPESYFSNILCGRRNMGYAVARKIEDRLQLGFGSLDQPPPPEDQRKLHATQPEPAPYHLRDPWLRRLAELSSTLTTDQREHLLRDAEGFAATNREQYDLLRKLFRDFNPPRPANGLPEAHDPSLSR